MNSHAPQTANDDSTVELLTLAEGTDLTAAAVRRDATYVLEGGGIVLLPKTGFPLSARERELLADLRNFLVKEPSGANGRPTIMFDPRRGRIADINFTISGLRLLRAEVKASARPELEAMMRRYGAWAEDLLTTLFPSYVAALGRDRITYRPNQRSDAQPLHVDAGYAYPTQGRGMLRVFCNIDPLDRPRVWHVGERFEGFARRYLPAARVRRPGWTASMLARVGVVGGAKTAYDLMIAELRRLVKSDAEYQRSAPRRVVEFPSGSAWIAITDLLLHGALSGQHSLDQTFFLPPEAMSDESRSSLRILERLSGRQLV
jgi:hypothetical protein